MLDIIPVIIGVILLIRGRFTLAGRYVSTSAGRLIGALLIAPTVFTLCAGMVLGVSIAMERLQTSDSEEITIDPNDPVLLSEITGMLGELFTVQLVLLAGALALAVYMIWRSPTEPPAATETLAGAGPWNAPAPLRPAAPGARVPDILTVPEAAAYLRISEEELLALIDAGKLPAARMGGNNYRIARIAIEDFLNNAT